MNNPLFIVIALQVAGIAVIIAEFLIPSAGILSIVALGLIGYSLFEAFANISRLAGFCFVGADILMLPFVVIAGLKLIGRSPAALKQTLSNANGVSSQPKELDQILHRHGRTITPLHPAGIAMVDGKRYDVISRGGFIDKESDVIVAELSGNQIIVVQKPI